MSWSQYRSGHLASVWLFREPGVKEGRSEGCGWSVISSVVSEDEMGSLNVGNPVTEISRESHRVETSGGQMTDRRMRLRAATARGH
jgi:hypothetical protein